MAATEEQALTSLRRMILDGTIGAGERISEVKASDLLGVSRTPARAALANLAFEGLIEKREGRGYTVKEMNVEDLRKAGAVRAVLEGLAASTMARDGLTDEARCTLRHSLAETHAVATRDTHADEDVDRYQDANKVFHLTIVRECGNEYVSHAYERLLHLPMLGPDIISSHSRRVEQGKMRMFVAHTQHVMIFDAIEAREVLRAENLMREHSNTALRYSELQSTDGIHAPTAAALEWKS